MPSSFSIPKPPQTKVSRSKPEGLPDKFWDTTLQQPRIKDLVKSYLELEKMLSQTTLSSEKDIDNTSGVSFRQRLSVPEKAADYSVTLDGESITIDADIRNILHKAHFSQHQVQILYELARDKMIPILSDVAVQLDADQQIERLIQHFGGKERWHQVSKQLRQWAQINLPADVFELMASTCEGVMAMENMMRAPEPAPFKKTGRQGKTDEQTLRQLIASPRYWRDKDPEALRQVKEGYESLYQRA